ncbi:SDR family NAD(P)-dependent oxidoreductase [Tunturiibacter psychrotolerans]|uniref:SDR family NAD(P)-dependent oxidoreductase n=1 Tax=Tunturiibacter psychrotolerans TaxID=3069686 RepID=UPI003D234649
MNHALDSKDRRAVLERAVRTIGEMQAKLDALEREKREPIAIIGMSCRFPGQATSLEAYWNLLRDGGDAIREVPPDRWDIDAFYDPDPDCPGKMYTRMGGFLEEVDKFDAYFFGMSARETLKTDPQQRLATEVSWEAVEDAGINPKDLSGAQIGVFLGITNSDYARVVERAGLESIDAYHLTGNCLNFAAGRIAYLFGFHGPALAVDTACSSSGVSVHLACQSLRNRECNTALAGGVNLILSPEISITSTKARTLSPDGRCKTFDASANGYVRGEGCGIVVLKRLCDALADGDRIRAVIRGSAVNQDGATSGITVPNKAAQAEVLRQALERAGIEPNQVDYVEAHGTGTTLGDPIEVRALAAVYGKSRSVDRPLIIGTAKTNVGHLESAAGVAGLIKTVLSLEHGIIPPHLHFKKLNPAISLDDIPAVIPVQPMPWPGTNKARMAAVSSFGGSGTIVHTIVAAAPEASPAVERDFRTSQIFCLSAKDPGALHTLADRYERRLADHPTDSLADICYTADAGRAHFNHRLAIVSSRPEELRERLTAYRAGEDCAGLSHNKCSGDQKPKVAFLFTGQGGQYVNMARKLYDGEPIFREILDRCDELLRPYLPRSLRSVLYPEKGESTPLDETQYTHVAMFAVQYGLAALWRSWGVEPSLVMGHSVGEIVAATVAGQMSFEDGLKLMRERGRLMQSLPATGMMASLMADEKRVANAILPFRDRVSIAAINGPESTVISGERLAVEAILRQQEDAGTVVKVLKVSNAFHSPLVEPVLAEFEASAKEVQYSAPQLPLFSSMRLEMVGRNNLLDASYWRHNLRNTVRFSSAIGKLYELGHRMFVEMGPSPILVRMGSQCVPVGEGTWLPSLREDRDDGQQLLETLGQLYVNGVSVNWLGFYQNRRARKVTLPTYPFQRERYWVDSPPCSPSRVGGAAAQTTATGHPLLGFRLRSAVPVFELELSAASIPFLEQHRVFGKSVLPATAYLELAMAAAAETFDSRQCVVKNLVLIRPLILPEGERRTIQMVMNEVEPGASTFQIFCLQRKDKKNDGEWVLHATAEISRVASGDSMQEPGNIAEIQRRCNQKVEAETFYESLRLRGLEFGSDFKGLVGLWKRDAEAICLIQAADSLLAGTEPYHIHPAFLDTCLQPVGALLPNAAALDRGAQMYLPHRLETFRLFLPPPYRVWSHVTLRHSGGDDNDAVTADIDVLNSEGQKVCEVRGLVLRQARRGDIISSEQEDLQEWLYELAWEETPPSIAAVAQSAGFLPGPACIARELQAHSHQYRQDQGLEQFASLLPQLEALSTQYFRQALADLGWNAQQKHCFTTESIARDLRIPLRHHRLLARMFEILAEDGYVAQEGSEWKVLRTPARTEPEGELSVLLKQYPACSTELTLTGRCGRQFAKAMRGEIEALELLFPDGSLSDIEKLYRDSPYFSFYNQLIQQAVSEAANRLPAGQRLRILEIGAGTGSATSFVLSKLSPERTEYVFTDISTLFIFKARETFAAYPFVNYRVLDIEKNPSEQGFSPHSFDIVIAANVLHATADLRQALENVQTLLRPEGLLLLLEATRPLRFVDIIVGLTEGWWRFTDKEIRSSHALLSEEKWRDLLSARGFSQVAVSPKRDGEDVLSNQKVIMARGSHVVRSSEERKPSEAVTAKRRKWLVVGDGNGVASRVDKVLKSRGEECTLVPSGTDLEDLERLLASSGSRDESHPDEVICLLSVSDTSIPSDEWRAVKHRIRTGCETLLHLVNVLVSGGRPQTKNLRIVTRGAHPMDSDTGLAPLHQYPVAALGKTIALEYPELNCTHVDLDPAGAADEIEELLEEFSGRDGNKEHLVAFRGRRRFVMRLVQSEAASREAARTPGGDFKQPHQLTIPSPGVLDNLCLSVLERRAPGMGEVEIEVHATGLGFRDVLIALGQYPGTSQTLGYECAGKIARVGPGAAPFHVGQRVMAVGSGSFSSLLTISTDRIALIPERFCYEEAATIPSAFLTAHYALHRLAKISASDKVLIHAAAGGVGLAAVQLAQRAGAEVFATAGTPEKRAYLKSLGVAHVMDSRSLDFASEIMGIAGGHGVDVVLNCLTGDFIRQSFSVVTDVNGRFLEIGKTGIWDETQVAQLTGNLSYFPIDLALEFEKSPGLVRSLFDELLPDFSNDLLKPLPWKTFPISEAAGAFRFMAQARHTGKIVLSHPSGGELRTREVPSDADGKIVLTPDGTYLITGGMSGLGLLAAQWMFERGARHLVLMGRRVPSEAAVAAIRGMEKKGVQITIARGDVADRAYLAGLFASFGNSLPPLRGIVHSAGTLDDGVLPQQTWERFEKVMAPKVDGAWHLHTLSQDQPLDFFVLFSSAVSMLGSAGQGSHVAACAFEDALAHHRRNIGLPALSINWGPWAEIGAATQGTVNERLRTKGFRPIESRQGLRILDQLMLRDRVQVGVMSVNWRQYSDLITPEHRSMLLSKVCTAEVRLESEPQKVAQPPLLERLRHAPAKKRRQTLEAHIRDQAIKVLGLSPSFKLDLNQGLATYGMDSLMTIELKNRLQVSVGKTLSSTIVFDHPTVVALVEYLEQHVLQEMEDSKEASHATKLHEQNAGLIEVTELSEEEAEVILAKELSR